MTKDYAIYKGDKFLFVGTRKECAEYLGCKVETITFYTSKAYERRCKGRALNNENRLIVIVIEEDDE